MPKKYADINFTPPQDVRAAARRGLEMRRKYKRGGLSNKEASKQGIGSGVQRATNLANGDTVSPETIGRMVSFFARHEKNKDSKTPSGEPGAGQIAWLLWGGTPGQRWATKVKRQMEAADMQNKSLARLANEIVTLRSEAQQGLPIPQPLTYKSGGNTGAMIALFLPTGTGVRFVQSDPGALPLNELHVTLAYLGKADDLSFGQIKEAHALMRLISENHPPLTGHINGCGRFCNGDDDGDPFFIIPDLAALPNLRQIVIGGLRRQGIEGANDHGFVPHITLTYLPHAEYNPFDIIEKTPITFGNISLVLGDDRYDYPLAQGVPFNRKALVTKIGARHTGAECALIQQMHDLTLELGAECHPLTRRAGARHSHADQGMVQRIHDDCRGLGAECKALPERDPVYSSQTLKDGEIIKGSAGSGNFGHDGRPGRLGGSQSGGGLRRIGAKKDSKPGARKKAAKKFRDKRKQDKTLSDVPQNLTKMSKKQRAASVDKLSKLPLTELRKRQDLNDKQIKIAFDSRNTPALNNLRAREGILAEAVDKKEFGPKSKKDTKKSKASEISGNLNKRQKKALSSFGKEGKLGVDISSIPGTIKGTRVTKIGADTINKLSNEGLIRQTSLIGPSGFPRLKITNLGKEVLETKADLTTRAQSDAPNYQPASTPQRCANCRFFLGDPGRDWCELFDFTADQDYHCDAWEPQRPDEIPGYVANKADLAALTEGVLALRGKVKLT